MEINIFLKIQFSIDNVSKQGFLFDFKQPDMHNVLVFNIKIK